MNQVYLQAKMNERQQLCFAILYLVYESEYPITIDTIVHKLDRSITAEFVILVAHLIGTRHIRLQSIDGVIHYTKPAMSAQSHLPLPYYQIDPYKDDFTM
jgi:hypothetical protein